jgi:hypothetical protein
VIAAEIAEDLQAALDQFSLIASELKKYNTPAIRMRSSDIVTSASV